MPIIESKIYEILHGYFPFGFHLSRKSWEWLKVLNLLEHYQLGVMRSEIQAVRQLVDRYNQKMFRSSYAFRPVQAGQLLAVGLISDVLRYLVVSYCHNQIPGVISRGLEWTKQAKGARTVVLTSDSFLSQFPPSSVMRGNMTVEEFASGSSEVAPNGEIEADETILLFLANQNPAFGPYKDFFDDSDLRKQAPYQPLVESLEAFLDKQPAFAPTGMTLFKTLRAPMVACPDSLEDQIRYIRHQWAHFLPPELLERLLLVSDILKEERLLRGFGPGPLRVLQFGRDIYGDYGYLEPAAFSRDADWMSNVVIIAKTTYVWLDQLSKKYQRHIRYLSDIPDEELDRLARWGFTGLWLIGIWERSPASQKIKQMMGNPEAASSAYSLYDYVISDDLGGEAALQNLRDRAWKRGIRLASDMVPNHMGIYSKWVIEHPGWFIQLDYSPFPVYQFTGEDLSFDPRVAIQIEDGYWAHRDAAVVFKRIDKWTGDVKYIYHGNDGTNMPWNDTAQLNFLIPDVREAVIQMILHVARKFSVIRFDAAMTLAKRHYQRLWFPKPGDGGAIPSRAEHGLSKEAFDAVFTKEFWREVVDRIAAEVPDTLLIAEAFWLMEGYFVRTLGMHRVYNSAFMNMLKMEDNAKYRQTVKNVLEFSPEVVKRFVNFMNNPDELTAVQQFGKGDKYFGVAVLMVTMPGLPMFGHGQIEGFTEKYGMEYRRAYWDEQIDEDMVRRHENEIFPLMRRRHLFSGAANFAFYDFRTREGWVDENVFAYSNRAGDDRAIILYNNAFNTTTGWIHTSTAINTGTDAKQFLVRRSLAEALALKTGPGYYYTFRDHQSKLEYVRSGRQLAEEGLYAELHAYQYSAFLDFREIFDTDGAWGELARRLEGRGMPSLEKAFREMKLEPILIPFRGVVNSDLFGRLSDGDIKARADFMTGITDFYKASADFAGSGIKIDRILEKISGELDIFPVQRFIDGIRLDSKTAIALKELLSEGDWNSLEPVVLAWLSVHRLGEIMTTGDSTSPSENMTSSLIGQWMLPESIIGVFQQMGQEGSVAYSDALLVQALTGKEELFLAQEISWDQAVQRLLKDELVSRYLEVNLFNDILWLGKERLDKMVKALTCLTFVLLGADGRLNSATVGSVLGAAAKIIDAARDASYQVDKTLQLLTEQ